MKAQKTSQQKSFNLMIYAFLLFGGLFYLYYPKIQNYSATPKWLFVSISCLGLILLGKKIKVPWSATISSWYIFIAIYLMQSFASYNFWDALTRSVPFLLAPLSVVLLYRESTDLKEWYAKISTAIAVLIIPILLITLFEIVGLMASGDYSHLSTYAFRFTFGNRNQYSELLVLIVPLLATGIFYSTEKVKRILLFIVLILIYLIVTLLLNRASILVLYGLYPVFFLLFLLQKYKPKTRKIVYSILTISILGGLVVVSSPLRHKIPVVRNLLETRYGSGNERIQIWSNSIDLWKQSPLFGKGSGDWKIEILNTPLGFTKAEDSYVFYQRAHNEFIQIAVENGAIGLLAFLAFFVIGFVLLFKSNLDVRVKILLSSGVLAYLFIANFSFPNEKIELLLLLFLFLAPSLKQAAAAQYRIRLEKLALVVSVLGIFVLSSAWLKNERNYFNFKSDGDNLALSEMDKDFYSIDPTTTPIFWQEGNNFYNQKEYEKALFSYEKALKYNPNHAHVLNNLGSCHYALGEMEEAEKYYKRALTINPKFVESLMNYSSFLFNKGDIDGALDHILLIPPLKEPANYPMFIQTIAKAKYKWLMELHDDPPFEKFLTQTYDNDAFLYEISKKARISGECYEVELRNYFASNPTE